MARRRRKQKTVDDLPVTIVPTAPSDVEVLVCADAEASSPFTDNVYTTCGDCGRAVYHRPNVSAPRYVCWTCFERHVADGQVDGVTVTHRSILEALSSQRRN